MWWPAMAELLTGRQLVAELKRRGLGDWTPDAVRQWVREEPPCPIAKAGARGQAHRYSPDRVVAWLQAREGKESVKGWTPPPAAQSQSAPAARPAGADLGAMRDPRNIKAYHEARLAKLKADEIEGKLIPAEELEAAMRSMVLTVRSSLLALPSKIATRVAACENADAVRELLREELQRVLSRMSGEGSEEHHEAA